MRLKKDNVERIALDEATVMDLEKQGFHRMTVGEIADSEKEEKTQKTLEDMTVAELKALAKKKGLEGCSGLTKENLISILKG